MTQWVENPTGGRDRGPRGLAQAWIEVLVRPRRFFRTGVAPGDQAPGLIFAVAVAVVYVASRFAFLPGARPTVFGSVGASTLVGVLVVALLLAPAALHLTAALQTLVLIAAVPDRAGVSETVQVVAYATAPCALAGVGVPPAVCGAACPLLETAVAGWRLVCAAWGAGLLAYGIAAVHGTSLPRAVAASAVPAVLVFGYLYGGLFAAETALGIELIDATPPEG